MAEGQPGEVELVYLVLEDILALYVQIIGATDAEAADHLRNRDGVESALARPETYALYEDADIALQAAKARCGDLTAPPRRDRVLRARAAR